MRPAHEAGAQLDDTDLVRLRAYGTSHEVAAGDILFAPGEPNENFVVIETAAVDVERPGTPDAPAALLSTHGPGQFLGELNLLTGQTPYLTARVSQAGAVTLIDKEAFARLMREDARLSDRILRMFVARRAYLRSGEGARSVEILGSRWCSESSALRTWAARQQVPHLWLDVDTTKGAALASAVQAGSLDLPVAIALGRIERNATPTSLAAMLGLQADHHDDTVRDVVIIGGGPAGLAAALCSASEGLDTLLLEGKSIGGQAAASARIENYVGFPSGIAGGELTSRALVQAHKFGAQVSNPCAVTGLSSVDGDLSVELESGSRVLTRCVVIASGAHYNTLPLDDWTQYENTSIFYAATELEARACAGGPVVIVGGANSAGQAAIFLAEAGSSVTLVLRGTDLEARMSRYLAGRVRAHPDITLSTATSVTALHGSRSLEAVDVQDASGTVTMLPCVGLFCFIGASPITDYLGEAARDAHGFVRTDRDLQPHDLGVMWQLMGREPLPYETSIPGVLAVGDVRAGSVKRVAAAVGEGSAAVASVHRLLASSGHALRRPQPA
ncbi:FAD-dependent oxidoreductase [Nocardioides astragali]|uniref:FAD-dependent oxidoreductase n=1 Tax=Nocardioides astragali TaxID=1776736 RepID=A0ABW2N4L7_9ACTN|nr:FAD-dependent oxidoreductase [Nocardioides astragali]